MTSADDGSPHDRPTLVTGDLFEATGPHFGGAFESRPGEPAERSDRCRSTSGCRSIVTYSVDGRQREQAGDPLHVRRRPVVGSFVGWIYDPVTQAREDVGHRGGSGSEFSFARSARRSGICSYPGTVTQSRGFIPR
jgi:hypothetical protein